MDIDLATFREGMLINLSNIQDHRDEAKIKELFGDKEKLQDYVFQYIENFSTFANSIYSEMSLCKRDIYYVIGTLFKGYPQIEGATYRKYVEEVLNTLIGIQHLQRFLSSTEIYVIISYLTTVTGIPWPIWLKRIHTLPDLRAVYID